jgi:peptide/nickel transport system substrate-binding protein
VIRKLTVMLLSGVICLLGITSALAITYNEAPMLRTKVATGLLPPIEERLPLEPKILSAERNEVPKGNIDFEIGQYGGTLRSVRPGPDWNPDIFVMNDEPLLSAPKRYRRKRPQRF